MNLRCVFRQAIAEENSYGVIANYFIKHGHLVPDDFTIQMMRERLAKKDWGNGFILDGNIYQEPFYREYKMEQIPQLPFDPGVRIEIPNEELFLRVHPENFYSVFEYVQIFDYLNDLRLKKDKENENNNN